MNRLLRSLARVFTGIGIGLLVLWLCLFLYLRRPTFGSLPELDLPRSVPGVLRRHVTFLAEEIQQRDSDHPEQLDRAAEYIEQELRSLGVEVRNQTFETRGDSFRNVIASFGPSEGPLLVVGAHYDSFGLFDENPGADDNASGTAGLLELARLLAHTNPSGAVELVFFANEEPPSFASPAMGSAIHAASVKAGGRPLLGMICLEMIGYFTERQIWPNHLLSSLFPNRGDFIALVGHGQDRPLMRRMTRAFRASSSVAAVGITAPNWMPGTDASDHRNYWNEGFSALLVTDTAFLRNPNYHTPRDTPDTLDYERMAAVVDGVFRGVLAADRPPRDRGPSSAAEDPGNNPVPQETKPLGKLPRHVAHPNRARLHYPRVEAPQAQTLPKARIDELHSFQTEPSDEFLASGMRLRRDFEDRGAEG